MARARVSSRSLFGLSIAVCAASLLWLTLSLGYPLMEDGWQGEAIGQISVRVPWPWQGYGDPPPRYGQPLPFLVQVTRIEGQLVVTARKPLSACSSVAVSAPLPWRDARDALLLIDALRASAHISSSAVVEVSDTGVAHGQVIAVLDALLGAGYRQLTLMPAELPWSDGKVPCIRDDSWEAPSAAGWPSTY